MLKLEFMSGSPPRVREGLVNAETFVGTSGITPACAGRTYRTNHKSIYRQDHPRLCGKDKSEPFVSRFIAGSPPLAREELDFTLVIFRVIGITPACAGRTLLMPVDF